MSDEVYKKLCEEMARRGDATLGRISLSLMPSWRNCMILKDALSQPKPGLSLSSGYQPQIDPETCTGCETCIGRCPAKAIAMPENLPIIDPDRCFGCGVCAVGCPMEAIVMTEKEEVPIPLVNRKELEKAIGSNLLRYLNFH
jgi:Pyruvate/2-oxoacid:ferredoxin oxidoreductase delta subunit